MPRFVVRSAAVLALACFAGACGDSPAAVQPPAHMEIVAGDQQRAPVGSALPVAPAVRLRDASGAPVSGVAVTFRSASADPHGTLRDSAARTDADGVARLGGWTLGTKASAGYQVEACVDGAAGRGAALCRSFGAVAEPGAPAVIRAQGPTTAQTVGATIELGVQVEDQYGNVIPGSPLAVSVSGGDSAAVARPTPATVAWTVRGAPGAHNLTLTAGAASATVTVTVVAAAAGAAYTVAFASAPPPTGRMLDTIPGPVVRVTDAAGAPVGGVEVQFVVTSGEGAVAHPRDSLPIFVTGGALRGDTALTLFTDADGLVRLKGWALGPNPGPQTLEARVADVPDVAPLTARTTATGTLVPVRATAIAVGLWTSCALDDAGRASCWGDNRWGALGAGLPRTAVDGEFTRAARAVAVDGPRFTALASGPYTTCALDAAGTPWCWGLDLFEDVVPSALGVARPQAVMGGVPLASIAVGFGAACGVTTAGGGACWGPIGPLVGHGTGLPARAPSRVANVPRFREMGVGCGLTPDDQLYCWGDFIDTVPRIRTAPVLVPTTDSTRIAHLAFGFPTAFPGQPLGPQTTLGLTTDGRLASWAFSSGQGPIIRPDVPRSTSLAGNLARFCGISADGTAYCGGTRPAQPPQPAVPLPPTPVPGGVRFRQLAVGPIHACGIDVDGVVWCWGRGDEGQLGWGMPRSSAAPRRVVLRVDP